MAKKLLGPVSIIPEQDYVPGKKYEIYAIVNFLGTSYMSLKDKNNSLLSDVQSWQLVASKGEKGENAISYNLQSQTIPDYESLPLGLSELDTNKAWVVQEDKLIYVWDGLNFPAKGEGLLSFFPISKVDDFFDL